MKQEQMKWMMILIVVLAFGWALTGCSTDFHIGTTSRMFYPNAWKQGGDPRQGMFTSNYESGSDSFRTIGRRDGGVH